jgi:hypothetical protein
VRNFFLNERFREKWVINQKNEKCGEKKIGKNTLKISDYKSQEEQKNKKIKNC